MLKTLTRVADDVRLKAINAKLKKARSKRDDLRSEHVDSGL